MALRSKALAFCLPGAAASLREFASQASPSSSANAPQLPPCDFIPPKYTGPDKDEILALRKQYLNPAIFHYYKNPVMITDGHMQYLFDEHGRRYLDAFAGIVTVSCGHAHPAVTAAITAQSARLQHTTTIYLNDQIALYAKELTDRMPGNLKVAYFVNSGSEANDMALLLARLYTGNYDILALRNAYHGLSDATMDPYRGRFGNDGSAYAEDVQDVILSCTPGKVAAFISETIQGVGGAVPLADGYLPKVYEITREAGGVCIADEVQTGFGRTGSHYWGFETQGVVPDIVTLAKGIGNGLPMGAVVTTPEIAATLAQRLHFNTFGGNPVCSAGGRAVLKAIDDEKLQSNSAVVGEYLMTGLKNLQKKHDIIGDVRGKGLMIGVEMVKDRQTKEPAKKETVEIFEKAKGLGIVAGQRRIEWERF
ncbi:hypothetical protein Ndes2526B_g00679 [Nannochloris sp. 'desiccata']